MNHQRNYSIFDKEKIVVAVLIAVVLILIGFVIGSYCNGEEQLATCWIMCKPGSYVTIREKPDKDSAEHGRLDSGDSFQTDGETVDGWVTCCSGEGGWVYLGYVVTEKPQVIGERYMCNAVKQVACRKWMGGPQVDQKPWLKNGQTCEVFLMADGWAVTSRGYIRSEWLEFDAR